MEIWKKMWVGVFFLNTLYIGYRTPKEIFPYLLLSPKFCWETKGAPDGEKLVSTYLRLDVPQMEKSDENIHVFMRSQASDSSADFSWQHMQTGIRCPPKPEIVITRRCEDIPTWSQRLRHSFWVRPIYFHLRRHRPTMENTIRYKP